MQQIINTLRFVFAFTAYDNVSNTHYFGVREDGSLYHSTNWDAFYSIVGRYSTRNVLQCSMFYKKDQEQSIYANNAYSKPFVFIYSNAYLAYLDNGGIKPSFETIYKGVDFLSETDISYEHEAIDPETKYYAAYATCCEKD